MSNHDLAIKIAQALWGPWYCTNEGINARVAKIERVLEDAK